ncbi:MAG: virulence RhuM family protein [Clostridiales bacterium]|nr:virulence RhuM family protein [Clostridiales bacterium]
MKKKKEISMIRSSAAEYLTFITATGESDVNAIYFDENVWLTQKMMGLLYNVETHTINYHLKKIFSDGEIDENAVIRKFRITASDGKSYNTNHYNLKAIIAVGNKVDSPRAVQFRKWANEIVEEFTIKGFVMDDERLKNFGTVLTKDYFEEQLERIREIRLSERRFYQKITDIYATSIDYDSKAQTTRLFFAKVQNQLHWAIHGETAAEVIYHRADSEKQNMGLQRWWMQKMNNKIYYHYCSVDTFYNILQTDIIRFGNPLNMNDSAESIWFPAMVKDFLKVGLMMLK